MMSLLSSRSLLLLAFALCASCWATRSYGVEGDEPGAKPQAVAPAGDDSAKTEAPAGAKRALVFCGHPGDGEHAKRYAELTGKIVRGLTEKLGFPADGIVVLAGVEPVDGDDSLKADWPTATRSPATREALQTAITRLREETGPDDTLWVVSIGHAHYDGRLCWLNLPGPDLHHDDFNNAWKGLQCREQVFVMSTPASGFFTRGLSAAGRVVITSTEADLELNETLAPDALADVLFPSADAPVLDADEDGAISLFDLYIALARNVAKRYTGETLIATEHSLLEDNGDGRGSELQRDFLTVEEGGRPRKGAPPKPEAGRDGAVAARIRLPLELPPKPAEPEKPTEKTAEQAAEKPVEPSADKPAADPTPAEKPDAAEASKP